MAESITEGTLVRLTKQIGDYVEQDEELATIETDKIDIAVNAPHSGIIQQLLVCEGDTVTMDQTIFELQRADDISSESSLSSSTEKQESGTGNANSEKVPVSELVPSPENLALSTESESTTTPLAKGSQPIQDRAQEEPRFSAQEKRGETRVCIAKPIINNNCETFQEADMGYLQVKMTRIRKKTAEHLKQSQNTAAFLTTFNEVDMFKLMEFRRMNKDSVLKQHGIKLGYMGALARATSLALKETLAVNASIENGDTIVYRDYVDLSVAAAIPKGLVTPVIRNVESMGLVEIEKNILNLVTKVNELVIL